MADFKFYENKYKGNVIPDKATFQRIVIEATAYVDNFIVTQQARELFKHSQIEERYNLAVCSVADIIYSQSKQNNNKSSESVGNHSISYNLRTAEEMETEKRNKAMTYLRGTGLLYGGMH